MIRKIDQHTVYGRLASAFRETDETVIPIEKGNYYLNLTLGYVYDDSAVGRFEQILTIQNEKTGEWIFSVNNKGATDFPSQPVVETNLYLDDGLYRIFHFIVPQFWDGSQFITIGTFLLTKINLKKILE